MENMRGRRGIAERPSTRQLVYEDFQPIADWTNDSNSHVLLVDLPGFKKEEVKLEVNSNSIVTISGERQLSENIYKRFKENYSLPVDSDIDKISGKFDGGLLFVIIPKKVYEIEEEPKEQHLIADRIAEQNKQETCKIEEKPKKDGKDTNDHKSDHGNGIPEEGKREVSKKTEGKGGLNQDRGKKYEIGIKIGSVGTAIEMIGRNKGIVLAAVLGFSVGMYLSHKLR
ncbi:inactive protein RESTRICTED TEV MOVEMENT 2-like [Telopea speciosissima]|uniref:inactive protein RESTRICTED TEV MOVEMENT 2-like n=1 Tax=Telopea speciosissima TaxID=54955 RepID=UPI001CC5B02E|nr:inactive protein RESTRICTED TEV MOVEMENT 2-like [Telopea speciosissima]